MPSRPVAEDLHEWVSFEDPDEDRTWVFDVTFLTSRWTCIYGRGCQGVLTGPAPELEQGCCSYGAHFTGPDDRANVEAHAQRLRPDQWQHHRESARRGGPVKVTKAGETVTRLVDDACIFLNRPGFPGGAGCALHRAALDAGERHLDWKPDVCWQLPLRRTDDTDEQGHVTSTLREWKRRDWGDGGFDFHWWCTADPLAFVGDGAVYRALRDEIVELVGKVPYGLLADHLDRRTEHGAVALLPHPALRRRGADGGPFGPRRPSQR
ncbi:MAG: hypothetical protein HYX34_01670 [Actinobacteria bacterium]|nr:hypothetical protein [Actinomycetota bacterium]